MKNTKDDVWTAAHKAFSQTPPGKLTNVFECPKLVYSFIVDDNDVNNKVETQLVLWCHVTVAGKVLTVLCQLMIDRVAGLLYIATS